MSIEIVRNYLEQFGVQDRIVEFEVSSATVELAAKAVGCEPARITKTLSFQVGESCVLIAAAGDAKVDNAKYKKQFGVKAKMLHPEEVASMTGHAVGGVCPFGVPDGVKIYLDVSMKRFDLVYPAAGSSNSAIGMTPEELERFSKAEGWIDVCKGWEEE